MSMNSFDDDDFDDILGSDIDAFKSKDEKKDDLGGFDNNKNKNNEKKEENDLFGSNEYDPNKILDSLNDFDDDDFKFDNFNQQKTESNIKQSEKPLWSFDNNNKNNNNNHNIFSNNDKSLENESNGKESNFKDMIFNNASESKPSETKVTNSEPFSFLNHDSNHNVNNSNAISNNNNNNNNNNNLTENASTAFHSSYKNDTFSEISLLNDDDDDDILTGLGFGSKKNNKPVPAKEKKTKFTISFKF